MEIQEILISALSPAKYNPRKISLLQKEHLKKSLEKFGFVDPIVVNSKDGLNIIIGGHQRVKVWEEMGNKTVPVFFVELSEEDEKELNIRLNANGGEFDLVLLQEFFDEKVLGDWGLEVEFPEMDLVLSEDDFTRDENGKVSVQCGDIYKLGEHRLMCGDSTSREDVLRLMGEEKSQLVFTDPPYNVDYHSPDGASYNTGKYASANGTILNDDKSDAECVEFYTSVLKNIYEVSEDSAVLYWWFAHSQHHNSFQAFQKTGWKISQTLIWLKESMVLAKSQDYHHCYEPCLLGWKKGKKHFSREFPRNLKDAFVTAGEYQDAMDVWYEKRDITSEYIHPTQKPVRLAERALLKHSEKGFIVLDLFGGSGSTLMACEQSGRKSRVMEMDQKYCHRIISRWEKFTGKKAEKIS
ncbi:MAG: site-specific DNA-methyltransferase [Candidatus Peregrinibacteria bacterium]